MTAVTPFEPTLDVSPVAKKGAVTEDDWKLKDPTAEFRVSLTRPTDKDNELVKVAAKHGPAGILAVLRKNKDYSWFVVLAFRAIQMCLGPRQPQVAHPCLKECDPVAFAVQMMEIEMIDEIFHLMQYFSHVRDINHHGLAIIEILIMDDPEWRDEVARRGGVPLLCEVAKHRKDSPTIMCQVMTCMSYLAAEDYIEVMLCQYDALHYVAYVLKVHAANAELVTRAMLALLNLTVCEPHVEELMDKEAILPVVAVLDKHASDVHLVIIVMGVLANFSVKDETRDLLVREGVLQRVADAMRLDPGNPVMQVACLKALVNYSADADHYMIMDGAGIPNLVGQMMVEHAEDPGVQRYGNYFLGQHTTCPIL